MPNPQIPYVVNGTVTKSNSTNASSAIISFTIDSTTRSTTTNSQGQYVFDLAEIGYSSGDSVSYSAVDEFNNEVFNGTFTITGQNKTLNITLSSRTSAIFPPGNRSFQIFTVGGKPVSIDNPLPVKSV